MLPYLTRLAELCGLSLEPGTPAPKKTFPDAPDPVRILIVEDEQIVALDLQETLRQLGYDAHGLSATGEEALQMAHYTRPDIALVDICLRGPQDGIETATRLWRELNVAIIFFTAHTDTDTLNRAKQAEPYGYLPKPITAAMLKSTIELTAHRHARHLRALRRTQLAGRASADGPRYRDAG